jgi:outer membrane receptor protein involved in Fe transport
MIIVMDDSTDPVDVGFGIVQTKEESAFAVSYTPIEQVNRRSSFSIYNSLFGNVLGLTALQRSGAVWENDPALYIRGLQTLSNNNILVLVDGLERNIRYITPEEVNRSMFCVMLQLLLFML